VTMDPKTQFKDLDKLCTDLFKKEFVEDDVKEHSFGCETNSKIDNMKLTSTCDRSGSKGSGKVKFEADDKANGFKITESWSSSNELNFKVEASKLVDSAKVIVDAKYKEEGTKEPEKTIDGGFEYAFQSAAIAGNAVWNKKGVVGNASGVLHYGDFAFGGGAQFPISPKGDVLFGCKATWTRGGFLAHFFGEKNLTKFGVGVHHKIDSDRSLGVRVGVLRGGEASKVNKPLVEICGQQQLDAESNLKLKVNSEGSAGFAYLLKVNKSTTLGLKGNVQLAEFFSNAANASVFGLTLKFDF